MSESETQTYQGTVEMNENNSGGYWWLNEGDYDKLKAAGWQVTPPDGSLGGRKATLACQVQANDESEARDLMLNHAYASFDMQTDQYHAAKGCSCCGMPFQFGIWEDLVLVASPPATGHPEPEPEPLLATERRSLLLTLIGRLEKHKILTIEGEDAVAWPDILLEMMKLNDEETP